MERAFENEHAKLLKYTRKTICLFRKFSFCTKALFLKNKNGYKELYHGYLNMELKYYVLIIKNSRSTQKKPKKKTKITEKTRKVATIFIVYATLLVLVHWTVDAEL